MVADRIIAAMAAPFSLSAADVNIAVSIGIAHGQAGQDADQILQNADVSMYSAKRHWPGRYVLFEPHMQEAVRDRLALEADLRRAIDRDELTVQYQPIIALDTGRVAGVEALVRWHHPVRGALSPADFIPLAEECGLVVPLGRAVLARACRDVAGWRGLGGFTMPFHLAVNVSGKQLHASLADEVRVVLEASGLPAEMLLLEITEREVMRDTDSTLARLHELKALGVRLAIDDFGTGYSSLAYLQRFPIDVLKIDKSFVSNLGHDAQGTSLARTIVALTDALSLRTIAEGVEHTEQATVLQAMGCDCAQGYLFSRPVDGADMPLLLARAVREPLWPDSTIRAA
jgi:EAL domain-containing protein (putative c-di-GMP-specific phosphodiesterase class I)